MKTKLDYVLLFVAATMGGIVFSQGVSFARWSKFHPAEYFLDIHAWLLASAGVGIFCLAMIVMGLLIRIAELEKKIGGSNGERGE